MLDLPVRRRERLDLDVVVLHLRRKRNRLVPGDPRLDRRRRDEQGVHPGEELRVEVVAVAVRHETQGSRRLRHGGEIVGHVPEGSGLVREIGVDRRLPVGDGEGHVADEGGAERLSLRGGRAAPSRFRQSDGGHEGRPGTKTGRPGQRHFAMPIWVNTNA